MISTLFFQYSYVAFSFSNYIHSRKFGADLNGEGYLRVFFKVQTNKKKTFYGLVLCSKELASLTQRGRGLAFALGSWRRALSPWNILPDMNVSVYLPGGLRPHKIV